MINWDIVKFNSNGCYFSGQEVDGDVFFNIRIKILNGNSVGNIIINTNNQKQQIQKISNKSENLEIIINKCKYFCISFLVNKKRIEKINEIFK